MLSGKRFKLERATLAVEVIDGRRTAVTIPAGAIVKVAAGPVNGDGIMNVLWEGRKLAMFAVDVNVRGTEITDHSAKA
ncbi:MAG: hypothetical protein JWO19_48 [Bryobacterales bacterium]|nr:hypothetical protein [Bryobacterales bacterium]